MKSSGPRIPNMSISFTTEALFELALPIIASILTEWLDIRSVGRLDLACCNRIARASYIGTCQQKEVAFTVRTEQCIDYLLEWLILRQFHVVSCIYSFETDIVLFANYLSTNGDHLHHITIRGRDTDQAKSVEMVAITGQIALKCTHLKSVCFNKCSLIPCIADIFNANRNLVKLTFGNCKAYGTYPTNGFKLVLLRDVFVQNCELSASCAIYLGTLASSAKKLDISVENHDLPIFRLLVNPLSNLTRIDLGNVKLTDSDLTSIVLNCPQISALVIPECNHLTNAGVQFAIQHLSLKLLDIGYTYFADVVLQEVEKSCSTLEILLFECTSTFSVEAIASVLRNSPNINAIGMGWVGAKPEDFVKVVAPAFENLTTLVLIRDLKCNALLLAVAKYCRRLKKLDISDDGKSCTPNIRTGLVAVLTQCVHLRLLIMTPADIELHFSGTARVMLSCLRPGLRLSSNMGLLELF